MNPNNRKTFTDVEKAALLKSYHDSGKTKKAWCKETGVGLSTLHRWLHQDQSPMNPQPLPNWISVISTAPVPSKDLAIHVGKCTIPIDQRTDLNLLAGVLKVLVEVC